MNFDSSKTDPHTSNSINHKEVITDQGGRKNYSINNFDA